MGQLKTLGNTMLKTESTTWLGLLGLMVIIETSLVACNTSQINTIESTTAYPSAISLPIPLTYPSPVQTLASPISPSQAALHAQAYIAQRYSIPLENLQIHADHPTEFLALQRKFQVVTLVDNSPNGQIYKLMVSLADGEVIEDPSALYTAEAQAYAAHYGKLHPALYQRLQEIGETELITVSIWLASPPQESLADLEVIAIATLTAKYPEAKTAIEQSGKPMDVSDPALAQKISAEYSAIIQSQIQSRVQPLISELEKRGFSVKELVGLPTFIAILPKEVILELNQREEVATIDLAGGQVIQEASP